MSSSGECRFSGHMWESSRVDRDQYQETRIFCTTCGAGHTLEFRLAPNGEIVADITICPADGMSTVSREFVQWSVLAYEDTI